MKRYLIFSSCFIVVFLLLQVGAGFLLTLLHTPDMNAGWMGTSQEVTITSSQSPLLVTGFLAFLAASIAYFIPKRFTRTKE